jgi:methylmalonyl-CoA mutase
VQQNRDEKLKSQLELYPFLKHNPRKTLLEPILARRIAESLEQKRLDNE